MARRPIFINAPRATELPLTKDYCAQSRTPAGLLSLLILLFFQIRLPLTKPYSSCVNKLPRTEYFTFFLRNCHLRMKERIMPCSVGGAAMPKQPWHPLLIFLPQGGGGRSMAHSGRFVAEMNEEATDGRPCQPTGEPLIQIISIFLSYENLSSP